MIGVYINDGYLPFTEYIFNGWKEYETRNRDTLKNLVGERVAIVRTCPGEKTAVVGYVTIAKKVVITDFVEFYNLKTMIPIWWNKYSFSGKKYCYYLENPEKEKRPFSIPNNAKKHGRVWVEF